ncbi:PREDICTED: CDK5 regulatory subunit-associated protein 2-like [Nanorana parkeri]|uniref:CDK5 regulatory subunit-associated protein 2-like n=1 Tax=Nanorana parkeri TaxID=125878 RepID=UPI0008542DE6|nr:PREDICTED: CDK5 regulatory subunit-associated protein 2-like [Nanorana parkeri]
MDQDYAFHYEGDSLYIDKAYPPRAGYEIDHEPVKGYPRLSVDRAHTMKDFEKQITELKKENFNLKLRIYFLEEQVQRHCDNSSEELHRMNIELKVEVESLKHEYQEKQNLLIRASKAMESLAGERKSSIQQLKDDHLRQLQELQEANQRKAQLLEDELKQEKAELEKICRLLDQERMQRFTAEERLLAVKEQYNKSMGLLEERDWIIQCLNETLRSKDALNTQLEKQINAMMPSDTSSPSAANTVGLLPESDLKEGRSQSPGLTCRDCLATKSSEEKEESVNEWQKKVKEMGNVIKELQKKLDDHKVGFAVEEKNSVKRDKAIQGLTIALKKKSKENDKLLKEIDNLNAALAEARASGLRQQGQGLKSNSDPDYKKLILTIQAQQDLCSRLHEYERESGSLQKEFDAIVMLRKWLEKDIQSNQELRKVLEGQIMATYRESETMSFLGDQTSYMSICLDHLGDHNHLVDGSLEAVNRPHVKSVETQTSPLTEEHFNSLQGETMELSVIEKDTKEGSAAAVAIHPKHDLAEHSQNTASSSTQTELKRYADKGVLVDIFALGQETMESIQNGAKEILSASDSHQSTSDLSEGSWEIQSGKQQKCFSNNQTKSRIPVLFTSLSKRLKPEACLASRETEACLASRETEACLASRETEACLASRETEACRASRETEACRASRETEACRASRETEACRASRETEACRASRETEACRASRETEACRASRETEACRASRETEACRASRETEACRASRETEACRASRETEACRASRETEACRASRETEACLASRETEACLASRETEACLASRETEACRASRETEACRASRETEACRASRETEACRASRETEACRASRENEHNCLVVELQEENRRLLEELKCVKLEMEALKSKKEKSKSTQLGLDDTDNVGIESSRQILDGGLQSEIGLSEQVKCAQIKVEKLQPVEDAGKRTKFSSDLEKPEKEGRGSVQQSLHEGLQLWNVQVSEELKPAHLENEDHPSREAVSENTPTKSVRDHVNTAERDLSAQSLHEELQLENLRLAEQLHYAQKDIEKLQAREVKLENRNALSDSDNSYTLERDLAMSSLIEELQLENQRLVEQLKRARVEIEKLQEQKALQDIDSSFRLENLDTEDRDSEHSFLDKTVTNAISLTEIHSVNPGFEVQVNGDNFTCQNISGLCCHHNRFCIECANNQETLVVQSSSFKKVSTIKKECKLLTVSHSHRPFEDTSLSKYDLLVQSQARELSHQRQKIKESHNLSVVCSKNFINVMKAYEDLLSSSSLDSNIALGFQEQLAQTVEWLKELEYKLSDAYYGEDDANSDHSADSLLYTPSRLVPGHKMWADKHGCHVLGLVEDYNALRKQILEAKTVLEETEAFVDHGVQTAVLNMTEHFGNVFFEKLNRTKQSLEEANCLLKLLWRVSLPLQTHSSSYSIRQVEETNLEMTRLRKRVMEQEKLLSGMVKRVYSENQMKEDIEKLILNQLAMTHKILKRAKGNLVVQVVDKH